MLVKKGKSRLTLNLHLPLSLETGASMQDIDGDNAETQIQVPIPEIPADWQPPTLSYITRELSNDVDTSSMGLVVWRPSNPPVFDNIGLLVEENNKGQPSQQASQQGDLEEGSAEGDGKIPALVPIGAGNAENDDGMPRLIRDPRNQNPYAALADDSNDKVPNVDVSRPNNTNGTEDQEPRAYASVASSSSGSGDAGDQPSFAKLTKLPDTGMCQRWPHTDTQSNKRERTPKTKRAPKDHAVTTPSTMASIARDVCTNILSPLMGNKYEHNSIEEVSPANLNDSEIEESKTREPGIEEGVRETNTDIRSVKESKSQETEINIQSSSSSSHQPVYTRTRLAHLTSREREARLASENQVTTRSRSAERVNTPVTTPQTTQHNLTPNVRARQ